MTPFFILLYDLLLGPYNKDNRHAQMLTKKRPETVKLFSTFKTQRFWNVKDFSNIELGFVLIFEDSHLLCDKI